MFIRALTLKQIKSYGLGPAGEGVRMVFERGVNRIAGRNGAGKTTIVEALGYVLYGAEPEISGRQEGALALLRGGEKEGWVEAELELPRGVFTVRRNVGRQSEPCWHVLDAKGQLLHTQESEVRAFLASATGWNNPDTLHELFLKLIGVRQGRLWEPFELSPAEARRFFAPLLDVDVYARAQDELEAPALQIKAKINELEKAQERARGVAEVLSSAPSEQTLLEHRLNTGEPELEKRRGALALARGDLARLENAERKVPAVQARMEAARKNVEQAEAEVMNWREKAETVKRSAMQLAEHRAGFEAYKAAEQRLIELKARREGFKDLRGEKESAITAHAQAETRWKELDNATQDIKREIDTRESAWTQASLTWEEHRRAHETAFPKKRRLTSGALSGDDEDNAPPIWDSPAAHAEDAVLAENLSLLERWAAALGNAAESAIRAGEACSRANQSLTDYDPQRAVYAGRERDANKTAYENARHNLNNLEARRITRMEMSRELEKIQQCPLMTEKCRQFDPGKMVLSEVKLDEALEHARRLVAAVQQAYDVAEKTAKVAEKDREGTRDTRVRADQALTELIKLLALAEYQEGRGAFMRLSTALASNDVPPALLPVAPALPNPGLEPWVALEAAPRTASQFSNFARFVAGACAHWKPLLEQRREAHRERRRHYERGEEELRRETLRLAGLRAELDEARKRQAEWEAKTSAARREATEITAQLGSITSRVNEIERVETEIAAAELAVKTHEQAYLAFQLAEPGSKGIDEIEARQKLADINLQTARAESAYVLKERDEALGGYDSAAHQRAKDALPELTARLMTLENEISRDRELLIQARQRANACVQAREEYRGISEEVAVWKKRLERLEQAREALHAAGPRIAEFLVQAINAKAQRIYGALCPQDPGQLSWQPDYELRVVGAGGARRFASLSGGQKALAALAIQIALVQQFSRCGICVFDEPTFGLDASSRARLAQAVLEAQHAANFEQLFVVSHDDAFDGYVEHSVFLEYSPLAGTAAG